MKLSRASAYALTFLAHLAREKSDRPIPAHEAARLKGIPLHMLLKVLTPLEPAGILRTRRGPGGGHVLARAPKEITLLEVVEAVDGPLGGALQPVGDGEGKALDKQLQAVCDGAVGLVRERLSRVTLAELARGK
jgi:Rrf2 family protein